MFSRKTESPTDTTTRQKSPYFFVQPTIGKCVEDAVDDADDNDYFYNQRYSVYSLFRSQYTSNAETFCAAKADPIFLTNSGFANCGCGNAELAKSADTENRLRRMKTRNRIEMLLKRGGQDLEKFYSTHYALEDERDRVNDAANKKLSTRSASCGSDAEEFPKMDGRRVSMLVDELLLKIYGGRERTFSSGGTDVYPNDYSTDSSSNLVFKNNVILKKKCSFTAIPEDKRRKWFDVMRARLMGKSLSEMRTLKEALEYNVSYVGSMLIRQLKRKDFLIARRDAQCGVITAFLQAKSAKRSEDTKIQFSMKPSAGESGFQQWHGAMKMVARLSGGIPHEFRKTLWLTLAERHISSKNIKWSLVERTCFNDSTNPDDEELGVQIVKDLHRTGCSLFCGTSAEENQAVLKRVLLAYARWNKSVGYCQGFNMLAALILEVMDRCEYDSLKVMIYLIEGVLPESYFANSLRGLSIDMAVFRDLLRLKLPELSKHLEQLQLVSNDAAGNTYEPPLTNVFTMQWFLTLFSNCLPHSTVLRVWDLIFLEGNPILLKTALAIWDTLSDRIMPVKSADEFYSIMGVLTREMLEFGLMDANSLIKTITCIELYELTELRERYIYNITPWTQVARKGLRLFYSDDETEDSDDEPSDGKSSDRGYGFLKVATKHGSQSIRSISPSSLLAPLANEKDKIALDISALKKQYCKIKERQRQTQIIFTAACNTQDIMGSMVSTTPGSAINHLLLSKNLSSTAKLARNTKSSTAPVSRAVQRLKETSTSALQGDDALKDRGETVYWDKRKKKKRKRRRTEINFQKNGCDPPKSNTIDKCVDSDSSSTSTASSSFKSSTSTELCDDVGEFDSEDATTSEYCSSPHHKLRSSNASLPEDDKDAVVATDKRSQANTAKPDLPFDTSGYASSDCVNDLPNLYDSDQQQILNVLLTTSIIANEQLNNDALGESPHESADAPNDAGNADELRPRSDLHLSHFLNNVEKISRRVSYSTTVEHNPLFKTNSADNINYDQTGRKSFDFDDGIAERKSTTAPADIEKELENMKIDALEILFSSSTLESIRNEKRNDDECQTVREDLREDAKSSAEDVKFTFQINKDTEMALQRILHENTEVLKKVNQNYSTRQCRDPKTALISADEQRKSETNDLHETEANTADTASVNFNPLWYADDELAALEENKMEGDDDEFSVHSNGTEETEMNSLEYTNFLSDFRKNSGGLLEYQPNDSLFDAFAKDVDLRNNLDSNDYLYVQTKCEDDVNGSNDGQFRVKCKSLDNLNGKSKLKIGLVSRTGKWISISIDNSDLIINNATLVSNRDDEMAARQGVDHISDNAVGEKDTEIKTAHELHGFENTSFDGDSNSNNLCDPFLHLNFSIIPTGKKKKDPIEQYMQKKNMLMQSQKGAAELKTLNFNPFPARPTNRPPKEIGVKLGLYSSAKK